jgi:short-subunit dehydrogenase
MPPALLITPEECARAAIEGLEQGHRIVMPRRAVRAFSWVAAHTPRAIWLPACRKLMA